MSTTTVSDPAHYLKENLTKLPSSRFGIGFQQFVYNPVEVHQAGILPQVVLWFSEEDIRLAIATSYADFPWLRQRTHDFDLIVQNCKKLGPEAWKAKIEPTFKRGSVDRERLVSRFGRRGRWKVGYQRLLEGNDYFGGCKFEEVWEVFLHIQGLPVVPDGEIT